MTDRQFASYLMYPKVFTEYAAHRRRYGDVAMLPTPVFFYGMEPGQEISVDLERGKTLIVRYVTRSEPHEDGTRTVFFELNGQPRSMRVTDRSQTPKRAPPRKAEPGNPRHIGAPMPGIGGDGQRRGRARRSARGDVLVTIEAMKMEAAVRAEVDGRGGRGAGPAGQPDRCQGPAGGIALMWATHRPRQALSAGVTRGVERRFGAMAAGRRAVMALTRHNWGGAPWHERCTFVSR